MTSEELVRLLRGPFNFLRLDPEELRRLAPTAERILPPPQQIYLEDEIATPILGYPILMGDGAGRLRQALEEFVRAEERVQVAVLKRTSFDARAYGAAWKGYADELRRITANTTTSSYGRHFPAIFWLFHSIAISRLLKETPRRVVQVDLQVGREHGHELKYRVFHRLLDRVLQLTYDEVHRIARDLEEEEEELFPGILRQLGDNVLILTEDHVSADLSELGAYLQGYLGVEPRDLRERLERLHAWHERQLAEDAPMAAAVRHLLGDAEPRRLLLRPGYLAYLAEHPAYDRRRLLTPEQVRIWESLVLRLKEFELILGLRRRVVPVRQEDDRLVCRDPGLGWAAGSLRGELQLSAATRPLEFHTPWVVDPVVHRFGLIYDMTAFSEILSMVTHWGRDRQEDAFRMTFRFQRWVDRMARGHRLKLEKYMGDGALFSGRHPRRLLVAAVRLQRYYRRALGRGFPFDRGMRIALNHGAYRLLPVEGDRPGASDRYEFLGHGIVELSRLTTGKATREIEEVKNLLISRGYPAQTVDRFFAPILQKNVDLVDKAEQERRFHAYINSNNHLVNEGIVATEEFVHELEAEGEVGLLRRSRADRHSYVVLEVEADGQELAVGIRKLGMPTFKGLGELTVFEVVDGEGWSEGELEALPAAGLKQALDREFLRRRGRTAATR